MPVTMTMNGRATTLLGGDVSATRTSAAFVDCDHLGAANEDLLFGYDWEGRRVSKVVSNKVGGVWQLESRRHYLYDGWNLVAELNQSNVLERTHVWGLDLSGTLQGAGGVGGLLATVIHTGTNAGTYFAMYDGNGNVVGYVRAGDGAVVAQYEYGPFGELLRATGPLAREFNFLFSTKYFDWETGLYYYGYRYYNPTTGRWPNRDPIEELGGLNLYNYVGNNPINDIYPLGLHPVAELLAAIAAEDATAIELILSTYGESGMLSQAMMQAGRQALANIARKKALEQLTKQCKRLGESELKKLWKDKIHDIKKEIQKQFRDEIKKLGFGSNYDIGLDPAGNIVIIDKKTGAVIPTGTKPSDWLP